MTSMLQRSRKLISNCLMLRPGAITIPAVDERIRHAMEG
jgi:hypothetical protein